MASVSAHQIITRLTACLRLLMLATLVAACGGGGDGGGTSGTAPTISNLRYSPQGAYFQSGGTATITGAVDFSDPDGDLLTWTLAVFDASGQLVQSTTNPVQGVAGRTSGTLSAVAMVSRSTLGAFTFRIDVTDAQGRRSNALSGSFRISNFPWAALPPPPGWRAGFATASVGGLIYILGGADPNAAVIPAPAIDRVDIFNPLTGSWSTGVPMALPMKDFSARVLGGKIYAVGDTNLVLGTRVQEFDPATARWTLKVSPPTWHRDGSSAVAGGRLYVVGGDDAGFDTSRMESLDPAADQWRRDPSMPSARTHLTAVTVDVAPAGGAPTPRIFALGGYGSTRVPDAGFFRANESYDPVADSWQVRAAMPEAAGGMAACAFEARILTFGGDNVNRALNIVMQYEPARDAWTFKTPLPTPGTRMQAEVVNRKIYVFSGSAIQIYTPDDDIL